jgi:predicted regulator of Ras-like GTPase activity (Roadblock/LC7/MglB family)
VESEIDRLRKKVENFPSPSSYNRLAELLHLAKQEAEAETVCRKCIKEFPRNSQVYALLADIQLGTGRRSEAGDSLRCALERDGRNYAAARMYADWLAENRDIAGALAQLKQVLAFRAGDPAVTKRITELEGHLKGVPIGAVPAPRPPPPGTASAPRPPTPLSPPQRPAPPPSSAPPVRPTPGAGSAARPTPGSGVRRSAFDTLAAEHGVRAATVVDPQGQVVMSRSVPGLEGKDEILAAFASSIGEAVSELATLAGHPVPSSWVMGAEQGQILAFHRDNGFSVVTLADASVRPAMLELRARQALIDLGAT